MAILMNKVLYVLDSESENPNYQPFTTVSDEIFLTADKTAEDIYQLYGFDYETAVTSPVSKKVVRIFRLNDDETLSSDISPFILNWDLSSKYQQGIITTGNITLMNYNSEWNPSPISKTVWHGTKFKIMIGIYFDDVVFWKEYGIFVCGDISVDSKTGVLSMPVYDKFAILNGTVSGKRISRFEIPAGTGIKEAIELCLSTRKDDIGEITELNTSTIPDLSTASSVSTIPNSPSLHSIYLLTTDYDQGTTHWTKGYYYCKSTTPSDRFIKIETGKTYATTSNNNIKDIIRSNGVRFIKVKNDVFDSSPIIFPRKYLESTTPYTISKDENCTIGDIIIELADMISCDVRYDTAGHLTLTPGAITNDDLANRAVLWNFQDNDGFHTKPVYDIKFSNLVNQIIVAGSIDNGYQHKAVVINDNPRSQANIYLTTPSPLYIEDTQLTSDELCQTRAKYEMVKQGRLGVQLKFNSIFIPHLECNQLITLSDKDLGLLGGLFVIDSIEVSRDIQMEITVSNVNEVSF